MRVEETVARVRPERVKTLICPPGIVAEGVANGLSMPSVILQINGLLLAAPGAPSRMGMVFTMPVVVTCRGYRHRQECLCPVRGGARGTSVRWY